MKASWFRKHGYIRSDKDGPALLMYKPLNGDITPPRWIKQKKRPEQNNDKVIVTAFINGWCPAQNMVFERAKRACSLSGDLVEFKPVDTFNRETLLDRGISDALFVNDKQLNACRHHCPN
ncbi:MAG: hypothetical protein ABIH89_07955 [Elusimicrobiota bacterium]